MMAYVGVADKTNGGETVVTTLRTHGDEQVEKLSRGVDVDGMFA